MKLQTETSDLSILLISLPGALALINISQESSVHQSFKSLKLFFLTRGSVHKSIRAKGVVKGKRNHGETWALWAFVKSITRSQTREGNLYILELLYELLNHMPSIYYSDGPLRLEIGLPVLQPVIPGGQSVRLRWQRHFQRRPGGTVGKGVPKYGARPPAGFRL